MASLIGERALSTHDEAQLLLALREAADPAIKLPEVQLYDGALPPIERDRAMFLD